MELQSRYETQKQWLETEQERLRREIAQLNVDEEMAASARGGHSAYGNHLADNATDTFEQEKTLSLQKHLRGLLEQVEHALNKWDKGTYGLCDDCGEPIDPQRLQALPYANLCIHCKTKQQVKRSRL
ncbi:MAG: TraR/DksA C4-type zinc finger protein [Chloroflexi bacterium]|nr:TraR/DksA C4-type zinc finger protein [Chloroflexota bacterium]MCL5074411.1 TraR/DksA C4-type zinc finger protein [Chloroflexota bacterium]